jgi:hypothetical protein
MGSDLLKNIFTFGDHGRIKAALGELKKIEVDLKHAHGEMAQQRLSTNKCLEIVVQSKLAAVKRLRLLRRISKNLGVRERLISQGSVGSMKLGTSLRGIESTLGSAQIAKNLAKGTGVGISTALGTWALVGTLGSASTGTAIATLSGAAASNATLAWLGGGALAAGGGGMAVGVVVLGGIVLLPALAIIGIFNHIGANKKIAEISEASTKAIQVIATYKRTQLSLNALQRRGVELSDALQRATEVFEGQYRAASATLFPWLFLSRLKRTLRHFFGRPFFDERDLRVISPLLQVAAALAKLVDTTLMNEEGGIA